MRPHTPLINSLGLLVFVLGTLVNCTDISQTMPVNESQEDNQHLNLLYSPPAHIAILDSAFLRSMNPSRFIQFDSILQTVADSDRDLRFYLLNRLFIRAFIFEDQNDIAKWVNEISLMKPDTNTDHFQNIVDWKLNQAVLLFQDGEEWRNPMEEYISGYEAILGTQDTQMAAHYHLVAWLMYWNNLDPDEIIDLLEKEQTILEDHHIQEYPAVRNQYFLGATYYHDLGEFRTAITYLEQAKKMFPEDHRSHPSRLHRNTYHLLGSLYAEVYDSAKTMENFESSIALTKKMHQHHDRLLFEYTSFSTALDYIKAYDLVDSIASLFFELCPPDSYVKLADYERSLAFFYKEQGEESMAESFFLRAISNYQKAAEEDLMQGSYYDDALYGMAELKMYQGDLEKGLKYLKMAIPIWYGKSFDEVIFEVPLKFLAHHKNSHFYLETAAEYYRNKWEQHPDDQSAYQQALLIYQRLDTLFTIKRQTIFEENLFSSIEYEHRVYSKAIDLLTQQYIFQNQPSLINQVLEFMEKSRYGMLLSKVSLGNLAERYRIPASVLQRAILLNNLEKTLFASDDQSNPELFVELYQSKNLFYDSIRVSFPDFYAAIFNAPRIGLEEFGKYVRQHDAMGIQYHVFRNKIYTIATDGAVTYLESIPFSKTLLDTLLRYRNLISEFPPYNKRNIEDLDTFALLGSALYRSLLAPFANLLARKKTVFICADQVIEELSFEALMTNSTRSNSNGFHFDYLGKTHDIQYGFSFSSLFRVEGQNADLSNKELTLFSYSGRRIDKDIKKPELPGSYQEVVAAKEHWKKAKAKCYPGKKATRQRFEHALHTDGVIHLGLHASADTAERFGGQLFFRGEEDVFELVDLLKHQTRAKLVVLSACQTGKGVHYTGEGIFSIGLPFILAGADRVIVSSWDIEDQSTAIIMDIFYRELAKGLSAGQSLAEAKRAFILRYPDQAHPHFWSGLRLIS